MQRYKVVFFDDGRQFYYQTEIVAADDAGAIEKARDLFPTGIGAGYDIRSADRTIHTERFGPVQAAPQAQRRSRSA